MKINFVSFLNPYKFNGGGELVNRSILESAKSLGFDIKVISRVNNKYINRIIQPTYKGHRSPDLWILSDLYNVPEYGLRYHTDFIENVIQNERYIHMDNAYVDVCSSGPLPCNGNNKNCKKRCIYPIAEKIYANSIANIFVSPLHAKTVNKLFEHKFEHKALVLDPLIDTKTFYNRNVERDIKYLYVGTISNYKGYNNIIERFGNQVLFIGKNALGEPIQGRHIPFISNDQLPSYFNRAQNFVHLPNWIEPMGRTVIEAALCGCNLIVNDKVGACSFPYAISESRNIENSTTKFWKNLIDRINA